MAKKLDHRFWAKYFKVYDVLNMVIPYQELLDTIVKEAKIKKGDLVLDAGCGTGNLSMKCKAAGAKVIGIDYCIEALDRYKQKDPDAEMFVHDLTKPLPFPDNYFDGVVCNNVVYTLDKQAKVSLIKELNRVLRSKGSIIIADPHEQFKIFPIYIDHINKEFKKKGLFSTVINIIRMLVPTVKMFIYNIRIKSENKHGDYGFSLFGENKAILESSAFSTSEEIAVYSNQSRLIKGEKCNG